MKVISSRYRIDNDLILEIQRQGCDKDRMTCFPDRTSRPTEIKLTNCLCFSPNQLFGICMIERLIDS